jgi:hypothetical protein
MTNGIATTEGGTPTGMVHAMTGETTAVALVPGNAEQHNHPLRLATSLRPYKHHLLKMTN